MCHVRLTTVEPYFSPSHEDAIQEFHILLKLDSGEIKLKDNKLDQLRLMHIGTQPVPPSLVKHWKKYFPKMAYDTDYGLSESTGPGCVHLGIENEHKVGAIGLAGFNWETNILDEEGNPVRQGDVGELVGRGDGVMKEYYRNSEATAKAIRNGWLFTGDMAKQDEDGLFFLSIGKRISLSLVARIFSP